MVCPIEMAMLWVVHFVPLERIFAVEGDVALVLGIEIKLIQFR